MKMVICTGQEARIEMRGEARNHASSMNPWASRLETKDYMSVNKAVAESKSSRSPKFVVAPWNACRLLRLPTVWI